MKVIRASIFLLLLTLLWPAGTASAGTLDVEGTIDRVGLRVSIAPLKAHVERLPAAADVSTGWGSGTAANVSARRGPVNVDAAVGCVAARVASRLVSARVGLCREQRDPGAASAGADVVRSQLAAAIGCLRLAGVSGQLRVDLLAGTCGETGGAAETHAGLGDAALDGTVGCLAGSAADDSGVNVAASVGVCKAGGTGPAPSPGDGTGNDGGDGNGGNGGGVADETAGGATGGVLGAAASSELPYTGLPLWAVVLTGLSLVGFGVLLRRRRPELRRPTPSF
jgi:hypothetical protein